MGPKGSTGSGPALRSLVVDDDAAVRELLEDLLLSLGIDTQVAEDGREAEQWLRATKFDVLFLDVNLPHIRGDVLLEAIRQGSLQKPGAIVMMSADEALRAAPADQWFKRGVLGFLGKPFSREQIMAYLEAAKAARSQAGAHVEPAILVAGSGLWADALTRVVSRGGGRLVEARGPGEVPEVLRRERAACAIFGPPIPDQDLLLVVGTVRTTPEISTIPLLVGLPRADPRLEEELKVLGVTSTFVLPGGLPKLSTEVITAAGLSTRSHRRAPLAAPVKLHGSAAVLDAFALDLSEGGIGLTRIATKPPPGGFRVEFVLPGETAVVRAESQIAWTRQEGTAFRAGVRFTSIDVSDRTRIRRYVEARIV